MTTQQVLLHLDDGLLLRTAVDENDVERVALFNGTVEDPSVVGLTRSLFLHHPHTRGDDLFLVEDEATGQVVSSICLIPTVWRYDGVDLPVGELGIVGTAEAYRRRGLVRAQMGFFMRRLRERGCLLSSIRGIPYFYRQFGYEYALPLDGGLRLELRHVPEAPVPFTFRQATADDLPILMRLYDEAAQDLRLHTVRDEAIWRYMLTYTDGTDSEHQTWLVYDAGGRVAGSLRLPQHHFEKELTVNEVSRLSFDAALAVLAHLKALAESRGDPGICLELPVDCTLARLARSLGAHDLGRYAWQMHIPDLAALMRALAPALERRVAASPFAGLTREVRLGFYRRTLALRFHDGCLTEVADLGFTGEREPARFHPLAFVPLVLGYRTLDEQRAAYPDVIVAPTWRMLIETLFPKMVSFMYTAY